MCLCRGVFKIYHPGPNHKSTHAHTHVNKYTHIYICILGKLFMQKYDFTGIQIINVQSLSPTSTPPPSSSSSSLSAAFQAWDWILGKYFYKVLSYIQCGFFKTKFREDHLSYKNWNYFYKDHLSFKRRFF